MTPWKEKANRALLEAVAKQCPEKLPLVQQKNPSQLSPEEKKPIFSAILNEFLSSLDQNDEPSEYGELLDYWLPRFDPNCTIDLDD